MATHPSEIPKLRTELAAPHGPARWRPAVRFLLMLVLTAAFSFVALLAALLVFYVFFVLAPFLAGGIVWVLARPAWHRAHAARPRLRIVPSPSPDRRSACRDPGAPPTPSRAR